MTNNQPHLALSRVSPYLVPSQHFIVDLQFFNFCGYINYRGKSEKTTTQKHNAIQNDDTVVHFLYQNLKMNN